MVAGQCHRHKSRCKWPYIWQVATHLLADPYLVLDAVANGRGRLQLRALVPHAKHVRAAALEPKLMPLAVVVAHPQHAGVLDDFSSGRVDGEANAHAPLDEAAIPLGEGVGWVDGRGSLGWAGV